jgi:hypothetical protein
VTVKYSTLAYALMVTNRLSRVLLDMTDIPRVRIVVAIRPGSLLEPPAGCAELASNRLRPRPTSPQAVRVTAVIAGLAVKNFQKPF